MVKISASYPLFLSEGEAETFCQAQKPYERVKAVFQSRGLKEKVMQCSVYYGTQENGEYLCQMAMSVAGLGQLRHLSE